MYPCSPRDGLCALHPRRIIRLCQTCLLRQMLPKCQQICDHILCASQCFSTNVLLYEPCARSVFIWSTDSAAGPCTHACPGMACVHCTLIELYISVKHAFPGRGYGNANKVVNIQCALHNVFVQIYLGMKCKFSKVSSDPPRGPCTHTHPGMASVHCTTL